MDTSLKLHIGGKQTHPDWKILDIEDRPEVDFICDASSLQQFDDESVSAIYASHVLEHFHFGLDMELSKTLSEWYRVLKPEGELYLSVPDLQALCWLYMKPDLMLVDRFRIMKMMFGAQSNEYDIHKVGLDFYTLGFFLEHAGFHTYEAVSEFGMFDDCSSMKFLDTPISLNMIAIKQ